VRNLPASLVFYEDIYTCHPLFFQMRVVLVSTHIDQTTGYSKVAYNLLKQASTLAPRVKFFHYGFQRHPNTPGHRKAPAGVNLYDAAANEDPKEDGFGFNKIHEYLDMVGPDIVMIYNDPLIIHRFVESMKHDRKTSTYKLWIYVDQVYDGVAPLLMKTIREHADRVYCFTELWKQKFLTYGDFPDVRVLEHAVDSTTFTPLTDDARVALRKNLGIPANALVFLNANRNSQRKRLDLTIAGFARLLKTVPNAYMVLATNMNPQAGAYYDVPVIYQREVAKAGLDQMMLSRLILIDTSPPNVVGDEGINQLYNLADIGINTSDGEGFGLCQLEHMLTGAPQVVTDVGSFRTFLNESTSVFIPPSDDVYFSGAMPLGGWAPSFTADSVADAMKTAVETLPQLRAGVKSYKFKTWTQVCDGWLEDLLSA
jgi:glycosyltransferase involved in cell wall biosynthesis